MILTWLGGGGLGEWLEEWQKVDFAAGRFMLPTLSWDIF